jgi:hypothetical protein
MSLRLLIEVIFLLFLFSWSRGEALVVSSFSFPCRKENEAKEKTAANKTAYSQRVYLLSFSTGVVRD